MKLTERKLKKLIIEELNEVFSKEKERKLVEKLQKYIREQGLKTHAPAYSRGLFEVGPSGFRVVVKEIKDGVNRSEIGIIGLFPELESEQGVEQRTIWAENLKNLAKKFKEFYDEFENEYDVNDAQYEDWIDVQIQRSQGNATAGLATGAI